MDSSIASLPGFARRLTLLLGLLALTACSSMRSVDVSQAMRQGPPPGVMVGRLVEVRTLGGETLSFRVEEVTDQGLRGEPGFVAYANMRRLKVEDPNRYDEATGWVLGALGVAALVFLIANADSVNACSGDCPPPQP